VFWNSSQRNPTFYARGSHVETRMQFKNDEALWRQALANYPKAWGPHHFWG